MTIATTSIATNTNTSGATLAVTVPVGGVPSGATVIVCVAEASGTAGGSVTDTVGNTYAALVSVAVGGALFGSLFWCDNVVALSSGHTITFTKQTSGDEAAISAFYATGVLSASSSAGNGGSGASPSVTSGVPVGGAGDLAVGLVAVLGPSTDTYTQDAAFSTPPDRASSTSVYVAGGSVLTGAGAKTFAPTITSEQYCVAIGLFQHSLPARPTSQAILIM